MLLFITEKINCDIKSRKVEDSSKQRKYNGYDKVDGSSPTDVTESIFMTGAVDAREEHDTTVLNVANIFLHADNDKSVVMLFCGKLTKLMVRVCLDLYW